MKTKRDLDGQGIKPKCKPVWRTFAWWALALVLGACFYHFYRFLQRPLSAPDEARLAEAVGARHERAITRQQSQWRKENAKFTDAMIVAQRQKIKSAMLESGVSRAEVEGLWKSFDEVTSAKMGFNPHVSVKDEEIYVWPHYVEKGFVGEIPVWVFVCGWECEKFVNRPEAMPFHQWNIVLNSKAPYRYLDSINCN